MNENEKLMKEMLSKKKWAIIGATPNNEKIAYKILKRMLEHNYEVFCVNPNYEEIEGSICYKDIDSIPETPDCIDFVVPPLVTKATVEKLDSSKIRYLWFQPGSYNNEIVELAEQKGFQVVHDGACVMVAVNMKDEI